MIDYQELVGVFSKLVGTAKAPDQADANHTDQAELVDWKSVPEDQLEAYMNKLFCIADSNRDGVLQPEEFARLMTNSALDFADDVISEVSHTVSHSF